MSTHLRYLSRVSHWKLVAILATISLALIGAFTVVNASTALAEDSNAIDAPAVDIKIDNPTSTGGASAALVRDVYVVDDELVVTWKGGESGTDFVLPTRIKYGNITKNVSELISVDQMQDQNSEYLRRMSSDGNMTTYETLSAYAAQTHSVSLGKVSALNTSVEITWQIVRPVYRMYNMVTSEHLFTTQKTEYDNFVSIGKTDQDYWIGEGISWLAPTTGTTVERYYNAGLGAQGHSSHYYSSDATEIANLKAAGWTYDAGCDLISGGSTPIYTCYNEALGSAHHYTSSRTEWESLEANGWALEKDKNGIEPAKNVEGVFQGVVATSWNYSGNYYKVNHVIEGESSPFTTQWVSGTAGQRTAASALSVLGYEGTASSATIASNNSTVVSVNYTKANYQIKLNYNLEGQTAKNVDVTYASAMNPETPSANGKIFKGWYYDSNFTKPFTSGAAMPASDVRLFAQWEDDNTPDPIDPDPVPEPEPTFTVKFFSEQDDVQITSNGEQTIDKDGFAVAPTITVPEGKTIEKVTYIECDENGNISTAPEITDLSAYSITKDTYLSIRVTYVVVPDPEPEPEPEPEPVEPEKTTYTVTFKTVNDIISIDAADQTQTVEEGGYVARVPEVQAKFGYQINRITYYIGDESGNFNFLTGYSKENLTGTSEACKITKDTYFYIGVSYTKVATEYDEQGTLNFESFKVDDTSKTYTTKAIRPTVSSEIYKEGTDYTVEYKDNTNAGEACIVIRGAGQYTGAKGHNFTIKKLELTSSHVSVEGSLTFNGNTQTANIKVKTLDGVELTKDVHYTIEGNSARNAGETSFTVTGKDNCTGTVNSKFTIAKADVTVSGLTATNKEYSGTTDAALNESGKKVAGVKDESKVSIALKGDFENKNAGDNKKVNVTATLTGDDADNYNVNCSDDIKANITKRLVTVSGIKAHDKNADGSKNAVLDYSAAQIANKVEGDDVSVTATGTFDSELLGENKKVAISNITLTGKDAINYTVSTSSQVETTASIKNVNYTVKFDKNGGTEGVMNDQSRSVGDGNQLTAADYSKNGYGFKYWTTEQNGGGEVYADKYTGDIKNVTTGQTVTLYAQYTESTLGDFWIAKSSKITTSLSNAGIVNPEYSKPESNVALTQSEFEKAISQMVNLCAVGWVTKDTPDSAVSNLAECNWIRVFTEWMENDSYHLYTKQANRDVASSSLVKENDYIEMRVVQVGAHDGDKSVVTFQAIHILDKLFNVYDVNGGGECVNYQWYSTSLQRRLNNGGEIYNLFKSSLMNFNYTLSPSKHFVCGNFNDNSASKVWIMSASELSDVSTTTGAWAQLKQEGSQYQYWKNLGLSYYADNPKAIYELGKMRDGTESYGSASDGSGYNSNHHKNPIWLRSAWKGKKWDNHNDQETYFATADTRNGVTYINGGAPREDKRGVIPCIAFGA